MTHASIQHVAPGIDAAGHSIVEIRFPKHVLGHSADELVLCSTLPLVLRT